MNLKLLSLGFAAAMALNGAAFAQQRGAAPATPPAGPAPTFPGGATSVTETYESWIVSCGIVNNAKQCQVVQRLVDQRTGRTVVAVEMRPAADGKVQATFQLPFGLVLERGATTKIDETVGPNLSIRTCYPEGCQAPVTLEARQVTALRNGTVLNLSVVAADSNQDVPFQLQLKGLGTALDRAAALGR